MCSPNRNRHIHNDPTKGFALHHFLVKYDTYFHLFVFVSLFLLYFVMLFFFLLLLYKCLIPSIFRWQYLCLLCLCEINPSQPINQPARKNVSNMEEKKKRECGKKDLLRVCSKSRSNFDFHRNWMKLGATIYISWSWDFYSYWVNAPIFLKIYEQNMNGQNEEEKTREKGVQRGAFLRS